MLQIVNMKVQCQPLIVPLVMPIKADGKSDGADESVVNDVMTCW